MGKNMDLVEEHAYDLDRMDEARNVGEFCTLVKGAAAAHKAGDTLKNDEYHVAIDGVPVKQADGREGIAVSTLLSANLNRPGKMALVETLMDALEFTDEDIMIFCMGVLQRVKGNK